MCCDAVQAGRSITVFQRNLLLPWLAYSSMLKMETANSSETMVTFYQTTRAHISHLQEMVTMATNLILS